MKTMKVGPFTWQREDQDKEECWELVMPRELKLTHFCVKNYGGRPSDGHSFSGWRLVSGGPFNEAGGWTSRDAAMKGVVPYLLKYYRALIKERVESYAALSAAMKQWEKEVLQ